MSTVLFPEITQHANLVVVCLIVLVIGYSTCGGVRSVAFTDVYQFFLFCLCFPTLFFILIYYGNPSDSYRKLSTMPQFDLGKLLAWNGSLKSILIYYVYRSVFPFDPGRIQRFYMASSIDKAAKIFSRSAMIRVLLSLSFLGLAIALYVGGHIIKPTQNVIHYIIGLAYFPGMRGILVTAIIALLMSTADSNLHAASVLFTNDVWPVLTKRPLHSDRYALKILRIVSLCIGLLSICMVLYTTNITQLLRKTVYIYGPTVTVSFIMTCFRFRPRAAVILCNIAIHTCIMGYRLYYTHSTVVQQNIFEALVFSAALLLFIHYLFPKRPNTGWVGISDDSPVELQRQETKRWWLRKVKSFKAIFTQSYWVNIFPKRSSTFMKLGLYLIIYSSISLFYIQRSYILPYIYWYMAIMAIGTLVTFYPALHNYRKYSVDALCTLWPILLYIVLFVSPIAFAKLSHYAPVVCALAVASIALSSALLNFPITIIMLSILLFTYRWIIVSIPSNVALYPFDHITTLEWIASTVIGSVMLVGAIGYRYLRNKYNLKYSIMELAQSYERNTTLSSIHNQANWNRLDPTYSGKILQEIADTVDMQNLEAQKQKLYSFGRILLQRAKEERTLTLESGALKQVDINEILFKAYEIVRNLDKPLQLLVKYDTKVSHILTDIKLFERLLLINFFEICQSKQANDHILTLSIRETSLHYNCAAYRQNTINKDKRATPLRLPALAFCITTATSKDNILPTYDVVYESISSYLPKHVNSLYQIESRQIVQAHGGYTAIQETEESLTCLYVLPIDGSKVMHLKRCHTEDLFLGVGDKVDFLAQEEEFIELLVQKTALKRETINETIAFIKRVHGTTLRQSGEPYYTHPIEVAKIVSEINNDATTLLAALLHDTIEDSAVTLDQIELLYGREIAYLVDMVTHYNVHVFRWKLDGIENHLLLQACKDIRVLQIKLADRLHNLRTVSIRKPIDQVRIAKETLSFYIPWAKENNFSIWIDEIKNICKKILHVHPT